MARVFFPGSFDPLHLGHLDVIHIAQQLFGEVIVGVLYNRDKPHGSFSPEERVDLITQTINSGDGAIEPSMVEVLSSPRLAIEAAAEVGADFIVKGLRTAADYEIEQQMGHTNFAVGGIHTVMVLCRPEHSFVSSRFVREIAARGGDVRSLVSAPIADALSARFSSTD